VVAWLFPGQGTQEVGMGRALAERSPAAREVFARADAALGFPISKLCFDGPTEELTLTKHAQPAIVTASIAALSALREAWPELPAPGFALGHSLGEYSALVAAGALTLEDAVRLVHLRGSAMQEAVPPGKGAMAAIMGGDPAGVAALCDEAAAGEVLSPANFNAPGQIVISGAASAVARAVELAQAKKLKAIPLKVSAPFHCALMAPAARAVETALGRIALGALAFPVVANVDARPNTDPHRVPELLVRQIDSPVRWEESVAGVARAGVTRALEIGPGKVLAGLVKRIDKRITVLGVFEPDRLDEARAFLG
jgi:[acyl-carrier-protein] S-malonyltransferase